MKFWALISVGMGSAPITKDWPGDRAIVTTHSTGYRVAAVNSSRPRWTPTTIHGAGERLTGPSRPTTRLAVRAYSTSTPKISTA